MDITYKDTKAINLRSIQALFRRMEWWDWWTLGDIDWYFSHALYVVSAWDDRNLVGLGILTGDGRIDVHLSTLVVDANYQGRGIATAIVGRLVDRVAELKPYSFQTDVFDKRAERLYGRFGFRRNEGTWLLHHEATYMRWGPKAVAARKVRRAKGHTEDSASRSQPMEAMGQTERRQTELGQGRGDIGRKRNHDKKTTA